MTSADAVDGGGSSTGGGGGGGAGGNTAVPPSLNTSNRERLLWPYGASPYPTGCAMYCSPSSSNDEAAATTPVCASIDHSSSPFVARYATTFPLVVPWNTRPPAVASVPAPMVPSTGERHASF